MVKRSADDDNHDDDEDRSEKEEKKNRASHRQAMQSSARWFEPYAKVLYARRAISKYDALDAMTKSTIIRRTLATCQHSSSTSSSSNNSRRRSNSNSGGKEQDHPLKADAAPHSNHALVSVCGAPPPDERWWDAEIPTACELAVGASSSRSRSSTSAATSSSHMRSPTHMKRVRFMTPDYSVPLGSCPIYADVRTFDFVALGNLTKFDVIVMDPPWKLTATSTDRTAATTRGVDVPYELLEDAELIASLNLSTLQDAVVLEDEDEDEEEEQAGDHVIKQEAELREESKPKKEKGECTHTTTSPTNKHRKGGGWLFLWVINSRMSVALNMLEQWGYTYITSIDWVKTYPSGRLAASHGYFLQHAKETCLIARKLLRKTPPPTTRKVRRSTTHSSSVPNFFFPCDVLVDTRRDASQKTPALYEFIERMYADASDESGSSSNTRSSGRFLEIFGRSHNVRKGWVTIGNEL